MLETGRLAYIYLLGVYLGDGHISQHPRTTGLSISLDPRYPEVIGEIVRAIETVAGREPSRRDRSTRLGEATVVTSYAPFWPQLFPQHGPGKKHRRPIDLAPWQAAMTKQHPGNLIRGLIHSDGSRCVNRFRTPLPSGRTAAYAYPRYFFTNYSEDIQRIFCEHCALLGIRWTRSSRKNISVANRESVATLDALVGPKR